MKSKAFFTASRLIVMVLACVSLLSIASCSKDDDKPGIVGTWVYGKSTFRFESDGTGVYKTGGDIWGDFKYNVSSGTVYMRIIYVNNRNNNVWRDEIEGSYSSSEDIFWYNGKKYTRK